MLRINALGGLTIFEDAGPVSGAAAQPRRLAILAHRVLARLKQAETHLAALTNGRPNTQ